MLVAFVSRIGACKYLTLSAFIFILIHKKIVLFE